MLYYYYTHTAECTDYTFFTPFSLQSIVSIIAVFTQLHYGAFSLVIVYFPSPSLSLVLPCLSSGSLILACVYWITRLIQPDKPEAAKQNLMFKKSKVKSPTNANTDHYNGDIQILIFCDSAC